MNERLVQVLANRPDNYILPFFWQHSENETLLREGMARIAESGIGAVCVESRPHPDFLGKKWWTDLDVIMDEAKRRGMRVWVLDDAHFPSGMCNGKVTENSPYGKDYLTHVCTDVVGPMKGCAFMVRLEPDEQLLGVVLGRVDRSKPDTLTDVIDLTDRVREGKVYVEIPEGIWSAVILKTTRRGTGRKNYINTLDRKAVRFFIDTVYEPHYARYGTDFGGTFAGFFSDEPEIGNGTSEHGHHLRAGQPDILLPWSAELEQLLQDAWGERFAVKLASLFAEIGGRAASAANRVCFTSLVARLYGENFCCQIGDWCRAHGVEYIGHVIEDDGRHAQLGLGTAHFFRALWGQDMAGIDVVLQQLRPQLDDFRFHTVGGIGTYNGEFFHYGLAKLGTSLAKLDPKKRGRTMCEVFGAYGWAEGLKQMKWILDHMLVNGVNWFVPHAFTMKDFPDPDCPPHFYARGNNPQFPYFRHLMEYTNRVSHLISGGSSSVSVAILYTAEQEWAGNVTQFERAAKELARGQIECNIIPADVLASARMEGGKLYLRDDAVSALIVCGGEWIEEAAANAVLRASAAGVDVYVYAGDVPEILEQDGRTASFPEDALHIIPEGALAETLCRSGHFEISAEGDAKWLRFYHYVREEADYLLFFNEAACDRLDVRITRSGGVRSGLWYDPWTNTTSPCPDGDSFRLSLSAYELKILVLTRGDTEICAPDDSFPSLREFTLPEKGWRISLKRAGTQAFRPVKETVLCDLTAPEKYPFFSGTACYEMKFDWQGTVPKSAALSLVEVYETAQVFINGIEAGVRIAPPYVFDVGKALRPGENQLEILVVNTLVHQERDFLSMTMPMEPSGLLGPVTITWEE